MNQQKQSTEAQLPNRFWFCMVSVGWRLETHGICLGAKFRLDRFILSPSGNEKPQFLPYFRLRHFVVSPAGSNLRKLSTGAQLQTVPYPTVSKSFLYSNAFTAKSGAQSLTFKSVTDRQTDRHTNKNLTFFGRPGGGWNSSPTKLGTVIRGPRARSCTSKTYGVWRIVSPLGGAENFGITRPRQLKTLITP